MKYTLMQKNEKVIMLDINDFSGNIVNTGKVFMQERLPFSVLHRESHADLLGSMQEWMNYRNIPKTRGEIGLYLKAGQSTTINSLSLRSLGLNLTDQYWFKPKNIEISWKDVNFFQNDFSEKPLQMEFINEEPSPDYSSNGNLPKYWTIRDGGRFLLKAGKKPYFQQVDNEVIASDILSQADIPHVNYKALIINGKNYSSCQTFITPDTEYIPAYEILGVLPKSSNISLYNHFKACMCQIGLENQMPMIDHMLQFDYIINNTDRHMGNFGFIRDVNTLKMVGIAPIFDNGNSLWFDTLTPNIHPYKQPAFPFAAKQDKQLKLAGQEMDWIERLSDDFLSQTIANRLSNNPNIDEERIHKIQTTVLQLKRNLEMQRQYGHIHGIFKKESSNHNYTR